MSFSYVTTYAATKDVSGLSAYLSEHKRHAYIIPPRRGYAIIYDEKAASYNPIEFHDFTRLVAEYVQGLALTISNYRDVERTIVAYQDSHYLPPTAQGFRVLVSTQQQSQQLATLFAQSESAVSQQHEQLARVLRLPFVNAQWAFDELLNNDQDLGNTEPFAVKVATRRLLGSFDTESRSKSLSLEREIRRLIRQKRVISAVALYQQHKGVTFQEARKYIDQIANDKALSQ